LKRFINSLVVKGYTFDYVYGVAVTKAGYKLAKKNDFEIVKRIKLGVYFISLKITSAIFIKQ
ncbi:MAG: hypothetical protein MJ213_05970, partial [Bacilli bacterium]|nr:hypothetical protein [Bacilli bacterium]